MGRARVAPWVTAAVDGMTDAAFGIGTRDQARRELRALKGAADALRFELQRGEAGGHALSCQCKSCRALSRLDALSKGRGGR